MDTDGKVEYHSESEYSLENTPPLDLSGDGDASDYNTYGDEWGGDAGSNKIPWDSWQNYEKVTQNGQQYAKVGDRLYSKHAVDRMQPSGNRFGPNIYQGLDGNDYGRSIVPQYVEDIISSTKPVYQSETGNFVHTSGTVKVIVNHDGAVVTIMIYQ